MLKGILILINGHPQYGRMAYNLCMSVKAVESFPVAVAGSASALSHLSENQLALFDKIIELKDGAYPVSSGVKLWAAEITPFEETLLLDADMLWLPERRPSALFEELKDVEFTAITEGYYDQATGEHDRHPMYFFWADPEEIVDRYKVTGKIYQWRSEVVYFKKTEQVESLFYTAQSVYYEPGLDSVKQYAGGVPDELGINVAAAVMDVHPHVYKWHPSYWHKMFDNVILAAPKLYKEYYLMSFGSNMASTTLKRFYDRIMKASAYKLGLQHLFPLQSKRDYLPERIKG